MTQQTETQPQPSKKSQAPTLDDKTRERVGFHFSTGVKIFDPETHEVVRQFRGD